MEFTYRHTFLCLLYFVIKATLSNGVRWNLMKCAPDTDQKVPDGEASDIGRFPWLGIVQHEFYLGGKTRFAITSGILIHPGFVLSVAEDIAKINPEQVVNNTKFIVWKSANEKYALDVREYILHPEYQEKETFASAALLELTNWVELRSIAPVKPVCLPFKGFGTFNDLYVTKMSDESKEMKKVTYKMNYVTDQDCHEFYYRSQLTFKKMTPSYPICAVSERMSAPCVWDGGSALITRQNWGYWMLLGFGVRGPGCGAPSRFITIHKFLNWIDEVINWNPIGDLRPDETAFYLRQLSPVKLTMYAGDVKVPSAIGQCERNERGGIIFKEASELLMNKNFGQGFYFMTLVSKNLKIKATCLLRALNCTQLSVSQVASFLCCNIHIEVNARTNAGVWIEHHCHRDLTGKMRGMRQPDFSRLECFLYYNSKAFVEFRFYFSFKALLEVSLYGKREERPYMPNPFFRTETTDYWYPTKRYFEFSRWWPYRVWLWHL